MDKRKSTVHRTTKASSFTDSLQPGDIITGADMLGIDDRVADALPPVGWLRGDASPFPMDVFDCRAAALTHVSMTGDPAIAESFSRQRRSDGTEYIGKLGLEQAYESELHGSTGYEKMETSAAGRAVRPGLPEVGRVTAGAAMCVYSCGIIRQGNRGQRCRRPRTPDQR